MRSVLGATDVLPVPKLSRFFIAIGLCLILGFASECFLASQLLAARPAAREGKVAFALTDSEAKVPKHFQLQPHEFTFTEQPLGEVSQRLSISYITFPSPVKTEHPQNNTVHCEYYCPKGDGPFPGVIVLHILGGDFELSRLFCNALAHKGTAALFVKMPYYGERRDPKSRRRMVSHQPKETVAGMTQAILMVTRNGGCGCIVHSAEQQTQTTQQCKCSLP